MSNNRKPYNNKKRGYYPRSLEELQNKKRELEAQELLLIEKSLTSNSPHKIVEAQQYLKNLEQKKESSLKSFTFAPEREFYSGLGYKNRPTSLTYELLRQMAKVPQISSIIQTRVDQAMNYNEFTTDMQKPGWTLQKKVSRFAEDKDRELSSSDKREIDGIVDWIEKGGTDVNEWDGEDWDEFRKKVYRDSWELDQGAFEVSWLRKGIPHQYQAVDGGTMRLAENYDDDHYIQSKEINGYLPKFVQVWKNQVYREYYPWELCLGMRNTTTNVRNNGYSNSELEVLIQIITWMLYGMQYNGHFFQQGSNPKGILNFKNNVDSTKLEEFKQAWRNTLSGVHNSHKMAVTSGAELEWVNMQQCLHKDSDVFTDIGKKSLGTLLGDKEEVYTNIWDGEEFSKARVFKTGDKKLCETTLSNRLSLKTSPDHRFLTLRNNEPSWVERKDLVLGDYVFVNKKSVDSTIEKLSYKGKVVEKDLLEILGWITGDGWIGDNLPSKKIMKLFYHPEKESDILHRHMQVFKKYGINARTYVDKIKKENIEKEMIKKGIFSMIYEKPYITILDSDFHKWVLDLGFTTSRVGKSIPEFLYSYNQEGKCSFLKGFFSADGSINENGSRVDITITNYNLKEQTRLLLMTEGIRCSSFKLKKTYVMSFNKENCIEDTVLLIKDRDVFFEKIGFIQEHKTARERDRQKSLYKTNETPVEFVQKIALEVKAFNKKLSSDVKLNKKDLHDLLNISKGHQKASIYKVISYAEKIGYKTPDFLNKYSLETVIELSESNESVEMVDVEMFNEKHQFVANGMIVHNSNKDMEFHQWNEFLTVLSCTLFRIDPDEVGFHLEGSKGMFGQDGQKERIKHSKEKGLEPFMRYWQTQYDKYLISPLTKGKYQFVFTGLDPEDEDAQLKRDKEVLADGGMSVQDFFLKYSNRELDQDKDILLNQVYLQYKQMDMMGGEESNAAVDEMTGEDENPFAQFEDKGEDPFLKSFDNYLKNGLKDEQPA